MHFPHALSVVSFPIVAAVFLASLVEFIEALTVVLAVASVSGWRTAAAGTLAGLAALAVIVVAAGPLLTHIDIKLLQAIAGLALILFGARWLRKAILRAAGKLALHDEAKIFDEQVGQLTGHHPSMYAGIDVTAAGAAFGGVLIEGVEVVFIVVTAGSAGGSLAAASLGAGIALAAVAAMGLLLRRPITQIPENTLKLLVGVMVCGLGVYWLGEGLGFSWPGRAWASLALSAGFLAFSLSMVQGIKRRRPLGES